MDTSYKSIRLDIDLTPFELFQTFQIGSGSILLESTMQHPELGRKSIIVTDPAAILSLKDGIFSEIRDGVSNSIQIEPLEYIQNILNAEKVNDESDNFSGGLVGYFSYDYGCSFENVGLTKPNSTHLPDLFFGIYTWGLTYDHYTKQWSLAGKGNLAKIAEKIFNSVKREKVGLDFSATKIKLNSNFSHDEYLNTVDRAKEYIAAGDIYQVNVTQQFSGTTSDSHLAIYSSLRENNPAPFSALMCIGDNEWVLSSSPELFLDIRKDFVETRPIKGTIKRGAINEEDEKLKQVLLESEKDAAELVMIVDLERNDLNRVCKVGTVKVPTLKMIESYASVHHLVSRIVGRLKQDKSLKELLWSMFPGGSITGAPKIRAMQIINELEPNKRGIYTGSIGYFGFNEVSKFNIAIRTMTWENGKVTIGVGGGIVSDSDPEKEYQETLHKAAAMFRALNAEIE